MCDINDKIPIGLADSKSVNSSSIVIFLFTLSGTWHKLEQASRKFPNPVNKRTAS